MEKRKERFESISGLRAMACLCVVCYHFFCLFIDDPGLGRDMLPWYPASRYFFEYSKNAVEMFFLISGFLIAWHYRDKIQTISFRTFFGRHYGKLIGASLVVTLWAWGNEAMRNLAGLQANQMAVTPIRILLSVLMINTGWFTSFRQTGLPVCSTMWFVNLLVLCYLLYFVLGRIGRNRYLFLGLCICMVIVGWICLEHTPKLPFLWTFNGRAYVPFFLGVLLCEFQASASETLRRYVTWVWTGFVAVFFVYHMIVGFERVFGVFGTMNYVRYFEFIAAPGILLGAVNLPPLRKALSWEPLCALGGLSAEIYYVHNNVLEDYWILNRITGDRVNLLAPAAFLLMLASVIPWAMLYRYRKGRLYGLIRKTEMRK